MLGVDSTGSTAAREVQRRWRAREAPDGDFIMFADGSLSVMSLLRSSPSDRLGDLRAERWQWAELLRATAWTPSHWADVDAVLASCARAGSRALAGESAAHGSIGWVALTADDDEQSLQWVAVCTGSNPFATAFLDEATVTATSTAGRIWTFPRNAPQQVTIAEDPAFRW
jgi:hypothetical protein